MKKIYFFLIFTIFLVLIPLTVFKVTPLEIIQKYPYTVITLFQRIIGLILFILLFVQIILGAFMGRFTEKLGGWVYKFHIFEGKLTYLLAIAHPVLLMLFSYFTGHKLDPYVVFVNACLLCQTPSGYYYTLGIVSFWLLTVTVLAAAFRNANTWMKTNWRKLHVLNYIVFLLVGLHGYFLGRDFRTQPFFSFAILAYAIIVCIVIFIELPRLFRIFKNW